MGSSILWRDKLIKVPEVFRERFLKYSFYEVWL